MRRLIVFTIELWREGADQIAVIREMTRMEIAGFFEKCAESPCIKRSR
jgi:hypothetical protein